MGFRRTVLMTGIVLVAALLPAAGGAADLSQTAERLADLRQRRGELQADLESGRIRLEGLEAARQEARRRLEEARARRVELAEELAKALEKLRTARVRLEERAQDLYMNGQQRSVALLLSLGSFEDIEQAVAYLSEAMASDVRLVGGLQRARAEIEAIESEAARIVADAEADGREAERAYLEAQSLYEGTRAEARILEQRIERLSAAWSEYRYGLAEQLVEQTGASGTLRDQTLAQASLRAGLPLGPASGVPAGLVSTGRVLQGVASWYGPGFHGRRASSGAIFDERDYTAAHKTLPFGTLLLVTYRDRQVVVMINDRGPFIKGRDFDLSRAAAEHLGLSLGRVIAELLVTAR